MEVAWQLRAALHDEGLNGFSHERVGGFFAGHGGGGTVARVNGGFSGKGKDLFSDAGKQQFTIAAGQVPAAHAIGEENIPAEKLMLGREIKAQASRAVAGHEKKFGAGPCLGKRS